MQRRQLLQLLALSPLSRFTYAANNELVVAVNETTVESAPLLMRHIPGIRVVRVPNGRVASAQLVSGEVDAATGSETQLLLNSAAQPNLRAILTLSECHYRMVARRSAGISKIADLRGKRIAHTPGTSSQFFLVDVLRNAKLTVADVELVTLEGADMPKALLDKQIDAMAMWEPHTQMAIDQLGADALVLADPEAYFERFNLNTTTTVLNDPDKRVILSKALVAITAASKGLRQNPRFYWPSVASAINTTESTLSKLWNQFRFPADLDSKALLALMTRMEPWAAEVGNRTPRSNTELAQLIDESVLRESNALPSGRKRL